MVHLPFKVKDDVDGSDMRCEFGCCPNGKKCTLKE